MDNSKIIEEILSKPNRNTAHTFIGKSVNIRVRFWKDKNRWFLDTDLYPTSNFDYTEKGQNILKELAIDSQFSDGIRLEKQTKRIFQISMSDDQKTGLGETISIWLKILDEITSDDRYVFSISL